MLFFENEKKNEAQNPLSWQKPIDSIAKKKGMNTYAYQNPNTIPGNTA